MISFLIFALLTLLSANLLFWSVFAACYHLPQNWWAPVCLLVCMCSAAAGFCFTALFGAMTAASALEQYAYWKMRRDLAKREKRDG